MSVTHLNQIKRRVQQAYSTLIARDELSEGDPNIADKVLTRCLASFAVQAVTDCSEIDAANSIIDGSDDNGLDAVFYSESQNTIVLVQSKWIKDGKAEPSSAEVLKFCRGVRDLVNSEFDRFNTRLQQRQDSIEHALSTFGCQIKLVLVHTGRTELAIHAQRSITDLLNELNDASEIAVFENLGQDKVYALMAESASGGGISLDVTLSSWGKIETPYAAYYGTVPGSEVANWWKKFGNLLFAKNLRSSLGNTEVNSQIISTIHERPMDFWYFNNGITVTAKSIEKTIAGGANRDVGSFRANGVHVVNGAQTVSSIGRYAGENLSHVSVPIRIISLQDTADEYEELITRSNNTQNRIEARDFVSQEKEQQRIRLELQMDGIDYHIARSEGYKPTDKSFDLEEATIALACSSSDPNLAVTAKKEIGRFWADLDKGPYKRLFNPNTSSLRVYHAVQIQRLIDMELRRMVKEIDKRSGKQYGVLIHGNRLLASVVFTRLKITQNLADPEFIAAGHSVAIATEVKRAILLITQKLTQEYPDNFPAVVFKNPTKSKVLFDACISSIASS
ncbi:MAG: AIPR family protein ['Candidatus Kapabacteria' thiocyanatum]|uniref:Abortive phage infection protein C-terminal domain-containing protein n=1 Tax=Candidatus Kapaibacterium thiocyanatum TaxID=1895771 RepID=A0A1M3KXF2_9BACT|nr:AIPR family protein ['Candidatus Kapabacteria' thiocyanatum]OJX57126.1 MAG: hypothetical protein BGO89_11525 ['Candidatus Kapabacteria' thiocyanatum]